jgi:hypothetical protein
MSPIWSRHFGRVALTLALEAVIHAERLGLAVITTPARSPESNGMSEGFVNTLRRNCLAATLVLADCTTKRGSASTYRTPCRMASFAFMLAYNLRATFGTRYGPPSAPIPRRSCSGSLRGRPTSRPQHGGSRAPTSRAGARLRGSGGQSAGPAPA